MRAYITTEGTCAEGDADLIANAPTDLAECVKEIERLREKVVSLESELFETQMGEDI